MSNSQLNKSKSGLKNSNEVTLSLSSNLIGGYNDETNFLHKLLLTDTYLSRLCKALAIVSSANIKFTIFKIKFIKYKKSSHLSEMEEHAP